MCEGVNGSGQFITARCYYPSYQCSCINQPTEYPSCQCTRDPHVTQQPGDNPDNTDNVTWKPLYVVSIGSGVLLIVILTSVACCCLCRQWYSRRGPLRVGEADKPPEYCDTPPPPYVHSLFYNTHPRPRTVQRGVGRILGTITTGPSSRHTTTPITSVEIAETNTRSSTAPNVAGNRGTYLGGGGTSSRAYSEEVAGAVIPGAVDRDNSYSDQGAGDVIILPCYRNNLPDDIQVVDVDYS